MNKEEIESLFSITVTPRNVGQALYIHAVVMPELVSVLEKYKNDLIELEEEK